MNAPPSFINTLAKSRFLSASIAIHLILVAAFGGVVLFKSINDDYDLISVGQEGFLSEVEEMAAESDDQWQEATEFEQPAQSTAAPNESSAAASAISTLSASSTFTVSSSTDFSQNGNTLNGRGSGIGGMAGNSGGLGGRGRGKLVGTIFGCKVEAEKLGVVLDVSFSAHPLINIAVREIEKGFPNAVIVLAPGCGMNGKMTGKVMPGKEFFEEIGRYTYSGAGPHMGTFLPALLQKNKDFKELWQKGNKQKRIFVLTLDMPAKGKGALIAGTQIAFDHLQKEGVDVIYWMADFKDGLQESVVEELAGKLKGKGIKVVQHDMDDQAPAPIGFHLAKRTGGSIIQGDPRKLK